MEKKSIILLFLVSSLMTININCTENIFENENQEIEPEITETTDVTKIDTEQIVQELHDLSPIFNLPYASTQISYKELNRIVSELVEDYTFLQEAYAINPGEGVKESLEETGQKLLSIQNSLKKLGSIFLLHHTLEEISKSNNINLTFSDVQSRNGINPTLVNQLGNNPILLQQMLEAQQAQLFAQLIQDQSINFQNLKNPNKTRNRIIAFFVISAIVGALGYIGYLKFTAWWNESIILKRHLNTLEDQGKAIHKIDRDVKNVSILNKELNQKAKNVIDVQKVTLDEIQKINSKVEKLEENGLRAMEVMKENNANKTILVRQQKEVKILKRSLKTAEEKLNYLENTILALASNMNKKQYETDGKIEEAVRIAKARQENLAKRKPRRKKIVRFRKKKKPGDDKK